MTRRRVRKATALRFVSLGHRRYEVRRFYCFFGAQEQILQALWLRGEEMLVCEEGDSMRTKDGSTDVLRDFLKYVSFNILGQCAYSCYTLADTFFVSSSLGTKGLTALNLAFPVFCFLSGTGLMIGMGGGIRYSVLKSCGRRLFAPGRRVLKSYAPMP